MGLTRQWTSSTTSSETQEANKRAQRSRSSIRWVRLAVPTKVNPLGGATGSRTARPLPTPARSLRSRDQRLPVGWDHRGRTTIGLVLPDAPLSEAVRVPESSRLGRCRRWSPTTPPSHIDWQSLMQLAGTSRTQPSHCWQSRSWSPPAPSAAGASARSRDSKRPVTLSLLPGVDMRRRRLHHQRGVTDLHGLAGLHGRDGPSAGWRGPSSGSRRTRHCG